MDESQFADRFRSSAIKRAKWRGLIRNALIVAGNRGDPTLQPTHRTLLPAPTIPILRETAQWAQSHASPHAPEDKRKCP
jgi:epoxyqueuosine reductase